ncbi:MAG TPA: spore maturation protein [Candidatus Anaerobutyricum avicola]|nr:spore maturation protein [Candidatus Anaerobutyricum avicola]
MRTFLWFSDFIVPFIMFYIVIYGFFNRANVYENFLDGVKEGFRIVIKIAPTMVALLVSIGIFRTSGALDFVSGLLAPLGELIHIPAEILPVFLVRIFSSSAAVSFVLDIFKEFGPDSMIGMMVSIMMSCTETVFYTITIYYMSVKVTKTRWTLPGAMVATVAGTIASVVITRMIL